MVSTIQSMTKITHDTSSAAGSVAGRSYPTPPDSVPILVNTATALEQMVAHLRRHPALALDTESNSFHAYYPKVCLIQITTFADSLHTDGSKVASEDSGGDGLSAAPVVDYLVDSLRLENMDALRDVLASGLEVVMHAAENDILLMQRDFGFRIPLVFDTQLAARVLGWDKVGLGAILEECFGVVSDKRMQRTDWGKRPLMAEQIAYAQMDTHYLFALRDLLVDALVEADRWDEARAAFYQLAQLDVAEHPLNERTVWQMKATHRVAFEELGTLEALWQWREAEAQRQNRPPFKVMGDDLLVMFAHRRPANIGQLKGLSGITSEQVRRYGAAIVAAVQDGGTRAQPAFPKPPVRAEMLLSNEASAVYERLRRWRTKRAQARGVAPEIVFNNDTLLAFAQQQPKTLEELAAVPLVGSWKAGAYGEEVLALLQGETA